MSTGYTYCLGVAYRLSIICKYSKHIYENKTLDELKSITQEYEILSDLDECLFEIQNECGTITYTRNLNRTTQTRLDRIDIPYKK